MSTYECLLCARHGVRGSSVRQIHDRFPRRTSQSSRETDDSVIWEGTRLVCVDLAGPLGWEKREQTGRRHLLQGPGVQSACWGWHPWAEWSHRSSLPWVPAQGDFHLWRIVLTVEGRTDGGARVDGVPPASSEEAWCLHCALCGTWDFTCSYFCCHLSQLSPRAGFTISMVSLPMIPFPMPMNMHGCWLIFGKREKSFI